MFRRASFDLSHSPPFDWHLIQFWPARLPTSAASTSNAFICVGGIPSFILQRVLSSKYSVFCSFLEARFLYTPKNDPSNGLHAGMATHQPLVRLRGDQSESNTLGSSSRGHFFCSQSLCTCTSESAVTLPERRADIRRCAKAPPSPENPARQTSKRSVEILMPVRSIRIYRNLEMLLACLESERNCGHL